MIFAERSPSPSARPDHPMNKPTFFKKDNNDNKNRKVKTLASVLEKKSKKQEDKNLNNSARGSKLIAPKVQTLKDSNEPIQSTGIPSISKTSYYTRAIYNQSRKHKTSAPSKVYSDTGSDYSAKNPDPKKMTAISRIQTKGVKLAKFDLIDAEKQESRTKTPKKMISNNHFSTPSNNRSNIKSRGLNSTVKSSQKSPIRQSDFNKTTPVRNIKSNGINRKSPVRETRVKKQVVRKHKEDIRRTKKITIKNPLYNTKQTPKFVPTNEDPGDGREQCRCCNRWFMPERIEKHEDACYKLQNTKRKKFDSTQQREADPDQRYLKSVIKTKTNKPQLKKQDKKKWKIESDQFRQAMRAARLGTVVPPTIDLSLVPCKHCGRSFNENAAERHIPFCAKKAKDTKMNIGVKGRK